MIKIFSNWIFIWFILYYFKIVKETPIIILIIGYLLSYVQLAYLYYNNANRYNIIKYLIINICFKLIPIIIILTDKELNRNINDNDIYVTIVIILFYLFIMSCLNSNPYNHYLMTIKTYINNDNNHIKSTISKTYDNIYNYLFIK